MNSTILHPDIENRGIGFDPRTKLLLLLTISIFVLGGTGGERLDPFMPFFCTIPFILNLLAKKWKTAFAYITAYALAWLLMVYVSPHTGGIVNFILMACYGILARFLPSLMMGTYLIGTTTVSEFTAAMNRMHVTDKITIPLSVMFRFFPTVADEFASINAAMKMREIRLGGKNVNKMLEYRMVPLMVCSAKIGEELNAAALTRGLGGEVKRTNICRIGFHVQDLLLIFICLIPYVIAVYEMVYHLLFV